MPAEVVNPQAADAVTFNNVKTIGELLAFATAQSANNAVAHGNLALSNATGLQQIGMQDALNAQRYSNERIHSFQSAMNAINVGLAASASNLLVSLDPSQAMSEKTLLESQRIAEEVAKLGAALNSLQIMSKVAQTTPPVSSPGPVTG